MIIKPDSDTYSIIGIVLKELDADKRDPEVMVEMDNKSYELFWENGDPVISEDITATKQQLVKLLGISERTFERLKQIEVFIPRDTRRRGVLIDGRRLTDSRTEEFTTILNLPRYFAFLEQKLGLAPDMLPVKRIPDARPTKSSTWQEDFDAFIQEFINEDDPDDG